MDKKQQLIESIYHNPRTGYRGIKDISSKTNLKPDEVKEYLETQDVYTKHHPKVLKFKRRRYYSPSIDEIWQCDLVFMEQKWLLDNDGYIYINLIIDTFSKYLWGVPLKTKQSQEVLKSFEQVFQSGRIPKKIHSDKGSEYIAKSVQSLFKKNNILWYTTENETKAMIIERCARTFQQMMYKYLTDNNTTRWVDILQDLIYNYNNSYHSSLKMTPTEASNPLNELQVYENLYSSDSRLGSLKSITLKSKFKKGNMVRTHKFGTKFDRGYKPTFADEILFIKEVINSEPVTYKLEDYHGNEVKGTYYEKELIAYNKEEEDYEYEYILKTRKTKDQNLIEAFVKWKGYADIFNSWVKLTPDQIANSIIIKNSGTPKKETKEKIRSKRKVAKGK